jgi:2-C-methyl-D-erythritol 4-phosphate cytidylyltransferase
MNGSGGVKKEYLFLSDPYTGGDGKPLTVLGAAAAAFAASSRIGSIVIVIPPGKDEETAKNAEDEARAALSGTLLAEPENRFFFVPGGSTRQQSVLKALLFLSQSGPEYVLIHDGARPWVSVSLIDRILDAAEQYGAAIPVLPVVETPKEVNRLPGRGEAGFIRRHLRRAETAAAQTPQGFIFAGILAAHEKAAAGGKDYTDDAEVWGEFAGKVAVVEGETANRKITFPEDLEPFGRIHG